MPSQSPTQKPSQDLTVIVPSSTTAQTSDPTAAAYSKAILIGDFCTAQQLSRDSAPAQQMTTPTSANMTGTALQRAGNNWLISSFWGCVLKSQKFNLFDGLKNCFDFLVVYTIINPLTQPASGEKLLEVAGFEPE